MQRLLVSLAAVGIFLGAGFMVTSDGAAAAPRVMFGMDAAGVGPQTAAGVKPDYGTFWIGPWTLKSGWGSVDASMTSLKDAGVTPAIHFYYWGDDISPSCVESGCWSSLHQAQKTRAGWRTLGDQLGDHLNAQLGGKPAVVFLESEFNKGGISTYEPFDGYLAVMADSIHARYPAAVVVLGFGNWDSGHWSTFDRAAAASDMVGLQGMRGSTRDSGATYDALYAATLAGVRTLQSLFHKPIVLTDLALSSYPEPTYLGRQGDALSTFFSGLPALKGAGVTAIIYRSWSDSPGMDLANFYGEAERHWGLAHATGSYKPAAQAWIDGVRNERAGAPPASKTPFAATFTPKETSNHWWIETTATGNAAVGKVDARVNGGPWTPLPKTTWGTYAASVQILSGQRVEFRATSIGGATSTSSAYTWS